MLYKVSRYGWDVCCIEYLGMDGDVCCIEYLGMGGMCVV